MILVSLFTIFAFFSIILGEFSQYPFGNTTFSLGLQDVLLIISLILLFTWKVGIKTDIYIPKVFYLIITFWLIGFLSLLMNLDFRGGFYLLRYILYSSTFLLGFFIIRSGFKLENFIFIVGIVSFILSLVGIFQYFLYPDLSTLTNFGYDPHQNRLVSTFLDPNFLGMYLSLSLIIITPFMKKSKFYLISLIITLIAIFLTFSRTGYITLFTEYLILGIFKYRKLLVLLFVGVALLFIFNLRFQERLTGIVHIDKSAVERFGSWNKGIEVFTYKPIIGVGFNNLRYVLSEKNLIPIYTTDGGHAGAGIDSSIIFVLATTGIMGILAFMAFWIYFLFFCIRDYLKDKDLISLCIICMIVGVFVGSQFINALFFPSIVFLLFLVFGAYYGSRKN